MRLLISPNKETPKHLHNVNVKKALFLGIEKEKRKERKYCTYLRFHIYFQKNYGRRSINLLKRKLYSQKI